MSDRTVVRIATAAVVCLAALTILLVLSAADWSATEHDTTSPTGTTAPRSLP